MPTQPVIAKLKELQFELETVSSAIKHIDEAAKVAITAASVLKKLSELTNEFKALEEKHRQELLKVHKEKIAALEVHLQSVLMEFKDKSKHIDQLIDETKKLEKGISNYYSEVKKINFPERLDKIDNQISSINIGIGNLQTAIQNTQGKIDATQSSINTQGQAIGDHFSRLESRMNERDAFWARENLLLRKEIKTSRIISIIIGSILVIGLLLVAFRLS